MSRAATCWIAAAVALAACRSADPPPDGETAAAAAATTPTTPTTGATALTADGWGPLRIGMTRAEVVAAAGDDANPEAVGGPDPATCDEFRPARAPEGLIVMVEQDRLTRITLTAGSDVETDRGFGVGDPATTIKAAYGSAAASALHKYAPPPAEYVTVWVTPPPAPEARGIRYEIGADGRTSHVHAGGASIEYVEGCL